MENLRVPDSIKIAMQKAIMEFWRSNDEEIILPRDILPVIDSISRAFAISLSENPIVPNTREANILIQERIDTGQLTNSDPPAFATVKGVIEQWLRRMFLAPEPETSPPEEWIRACARNVPKGAVTMKIYSAQGILLETVDLEAYRRGQKSK